MPADYPTQSYIGWPLCPAATRLQPRLPCKFNRSDPEVPVSASSRGAPYIQRVWVAITPRWLR